MDLKTCQDNLIDGSEKRATAYWNRSDYMFDKILMPLDDLIKIVENNMEEIEEFEPTNCMDYERFELGLKYLKKSRDYFNFIDD